MKTTSVAKLLEAVELALRGITENKELQKKMSGYGFTPQRTQEGKALAENLRLMSSTREQHQGDTRRLSHRIKQDSLTTREVFRDHVAIAKAAFRTEPLVIQELKIQKLYSIQWKWTQQALDFYSQAPAHMERLQQYGATAESFQQNQAAVEALLDMKAQRLQKKGKAEHSTQERNQKIKELRAWYGGFRKLARIAFQETPQLLETFGIVVRSQKTRKKAAQTPVAETQH